MKRFTDYLIRILGICFFIFAVWIVIREGEKVGWLHLWHIILSTPIWLLVVAFGLLICDYIVLSGYDVLALNYLKKKVPYPLIFSASSVGFAIGNTVGHTYISGGALRYLFYLIWFLCFRATQCEAHCLHMCNKKCHQPRCKKYCFDM